MCTYYILPVCVLRAQPWSSSEDDDDEQAPQTRTSVTQSRGENTVYESTGDPGASVSDWGL